MTINDYRLALKCPTNYNVLLHFLDRTPSENDSARLANQFGSKWTERVCIEGAASLKDQSGARREAAPEQNSANSGFVAPTIDANSSASTVTPSNLTIDAFLAIQAEIIEIETRTVELVNQMRRLFELDQLTTNTNLAIVARKHSLDMGNRGYFDHLSPEGKDVGDRLSAGGVTCSTWGENIYSLTSGYNQNDIRPNIILLPLESPEANELATQAAEGWFGSEGHRKNMLEGKFIRTGLGVNVVADDLSYTVIFTQVFCG